MNASAGPLDHPKAADLARHMPVGAAPPMPTGVSHRLHAPYLLFIGDVDDRLTAKTAFGLADWRPDAVRGQWRLTPGAVDVGVPDLTPAEARALGVRSLVVGAAPAGGQILPHWGEALAEAAEAGLDIVSGLHTRLETVPGLAAAAARGGGRLVDVREPPQGIPVGTGARRPGRRVLTVGTDCAIGKKYTALALHRAMLARGWHADFRATGQTGILIAGGGIPIDSVVADFIAGAAEQLAPAADPAHWDVIEGQGSLFHPSYAGVSLGLLHGAQPDAILLCVDPRRSEIDGCAGFALPSAAEAIRRNLEAAWLTNPDCRCVGVAFNGRGMGATQKADAVALLSAETGLPVVDPLVDPLDPVLDLLQG